MKVLFNLFLTLSLSVLSLNSFGQAAPYCPSINAQFGTGPSTTICQGSCAQLTASVVPVNQTTSYSVASTPYAPFSFTSGTSIIANQDDIWSGVLNLGFPFCYFGTQYTQAVVGSNGQLTFSLGVASGSNGWSINAALPNTTNLPGNTICAAFRDIDPTSSGNIYYATYGTAPCRSFVISWNNIPLFSGSCYPSQPASTFQLVLHETTNYIDVFINNSTSCTAWNGGYGIVGIQNAAASIGVAAPGRNYPSTWTGVNEGWRFTPTGPATYTVNWTGPTGPVGTGTTVNVCPTVNSTYTANMSVAPCGAAVSSYSSVVSVSVVPGPTLVTNSPTICGGGSATLTVSGATSYTWLPSNSTATSIVVSPTSTTIYTVQGKNGPSCTTSKTVQVTVSPSPTATPSSNSPICAGSTLSLTCNAQSSYTWTGPNSFSSNAQNPTIPSASTLAAGQYTVKVTSAGGCTATAVVNVVVNPAPGVTANNLGPICAGQTLSLTSTGAGPWSWTGPNAFSNATQNPTIPSASTLAAGVYTVVAGVGSCTALATTTVVVNPLPVPAPTNTGPYCPGQTIQLNVGAFSTYTWSGPNSFASNAQNPTAGSASTLTAGQYTVKVTSAGGCTATAVTTVVVNPTPTVTPGSNSPICAGSTLSLTVNAASTYTWSGPNSFSSNLQNPTIPSASTLATGAYTVTVTSVSGCTATAIVNVTVGPAPGVTANNSGPICAGTTLSLTSTGAGPWSWTGPNAFSNATQNPTIPSASTVAAGVYTVVGGVGTCTSLATTTVVVNALPTPTASNTGPYCPGATVQLNVGAFTTYTWNGPNSFASNTQNPTIPSASTLAAGQYTVKVTSTGGCTATAVTTVVFNPNPVIVIGSNSPVCLGTAINLNSSGGSTYSWSGPNSFSSALQNPTVPVSTLADAGVYTVTVTTAAGCTGTANVNVIVTTPTASANNAGPFCAGTTMSLSASAATSYTWSGPGGFSSNVGNATQANSTPAMSGTYTVIISIGTCTASATTNVVVNALPTPVANNNSPVCVGQTINFTGTGGTTYTWTGPSYTNTTQNPSITNASAANAGTYSLTITDVNGCKNVATTNVVVNALPVIVVNSPTTCVNTTINLTSNGGTTYSWSGPGGFTSANQNPNIPSAQLNMSGVYTVTVTNANGCINTATTNVSVMPVPNPVIASNSPVCAGGTLNLFGNGGTTYLWSGPGYSGPIQNPVINNVQTSASGVYTLLATTGTCTANITYTVTINPLPVFNFSGSNVTCNGLSNGTSTVNVTVGTGPYNYNWSTIPAQTSQAANGLNAGTYSCTVTDANGCTSMASTQITQPTVFTVTINSAATSACSGVPINITAIGNGGTGPYNYNWVSGPSSSLYSVNEAVSGNYNYVVNATDAFNCPASANINLTFFPQPTVTATSATLCAGQNTAILTASGANTYVWQPGNITGPTYPFSGNQTTSITVVGTTNGCSNTANTAVMVNPTPNANIVTSTAKGCVPTCVTFSANGASNITSYGWILNGAGITGSVNGAYCFDAASQYTLGLTVMDANGCMGTVTPVFVDIYPKPTADFNHAPIKPIVNIDQFVTFTDASWGTPIVSWNWYFMNTAQYTSTEQNPTFAYTEPGTYPVVLVVKSDNGCMDTLVRPLVVGEDFGIYVPNAFTPNGDGTNDIFQPKGFGIVKYEINIFDRWGEKVFSTKDFEKGWDGTMQSKHDVKYGIIEEGSYTWLINCTDVFGKSHELKGHVILMK
jgi:gliding motility-associated-like protein